MLRRYFLKLSALSVTALPLVCFQTNQASASTTHKVKIRGFKFDPRKLEVKVGDTIKFENRDQAAHTATAKDKSWDTGTLGFSQKAGIEVTEGMEADYSCRFHPGMKAKLIIS